MSLGIPEKSERKEFFLNRAGDLSISISSFRIFWEDFIMLVLNSWLPSDDLE